MEIRKNVSNHFHSTLTHWLMSTPRCLYGGIPWIDRLYDRRCFSSTVWCLNTSFSFYNMWLKKRSIATYYVISSQRKFWTFPEKAGIIEELKSGATTTNLSKKYGAAKSTISKLKIKKKLILREVACTYAGPGQRRTLKGSNHPEI